MARNFLKWLNTFTRTIRTSDYWVDWDKVLANVEKYKDELNILNGLIGVMNIESEFRRIVNKYPKTLECLPILIAIRGTQVELEQGIINFKSDSQHIDEICKFMDDSGLFKIFQNKNIKNLVDYLTGVEVGLDSNGRKNRGGHLMEDKFEQYLKDSKIQYDKEMYAKDVEKKYGIDLSPITNNSSSTKRFDFVFKQNDIVYGVEVNFYSGGGSKLNETARSYKEIALASKKIKNFRFMWVTDGLGWSSAKNNLKETFDVLPYIFNINNLKNGVLDKIKNWTNDIYDEIDVTAMEDIILK